MGPARFHCATLLLTLNVLNFNCALDCFALVPLKNVLKYMFCSWPNKTKRKILLQHNKEKKITLESFPSEELENLKYEQNGL